jgi:hypothetical protein
MTLIRDTQAPDPDIVHRVKNFTDRTYFTHCDTQIPARSARQPLTHNFHRCPTCRAAYKTNLGKLPRDLKEESNQ